MLYAHCVPKSAVLPVSVLMAASSTVRILLARFSRSFRRRPCARMDEDEGLASASVASMTAGGRGPSQAGRDQTLCPSDDVVEQTYRELIRFVEAAGRVA